MQSLSMENIIRPFVRIESRPLEVFTPPPVTDLEELPPAYIEWGDASNFITPQSQLENPYVTTIINNIDGSYVDLTDINNLNELQNLDIASIEQQLANFQNRVNRIEQTESIFDWERGIEIPEISREVSVVRVFNPDEMDLPEEERTSYLDVERIERITFRMPDGGQWTFVLNNGEE